MTFGNHPLENPNTLTPIYPIHITTLTALKGAWRGACGRVRGANGVGFGAYGGALWRKTCAHKTRNFEQKNAAKQAATCAAIDIKGPIL